MAAIPGEWWVGSDGKIVENPIFVFAEKVAGTEFGIFAAIISVYVSPWHLRYSCLIPLPVCNGSR